MTLWTLAHQASLSVGFTRQEYGWGLSLPSQHVCVCVCVCVCVYVCIHSVKYYHLSRGRLGFSTLMGRQHPFLVSLVAQMVKNLPAVQKTWVWSLGWEDPLEKGIATHSSIFAWRIPWTEEPGRLQSVELQRVRHDWVINTFPSLSYICVCVCM